MCFLMSDGECRGQRTIIWNVERESADAEMREIESSCAGSAVFLFPSPRLPRRQSSPLSRDYSSRASASEASPFPPPPLLILHSSRFTSFFTRLPLPAFTLSQSAPTPAHRVNTSRTQCKRISLLVQVLVIVFAAHLNIPKPKVYS